MDTLTIDYLQETGVELTNIDTSLEETKGKQQEQLLKYKNIFFNKQKNITSKALSDQTQEDYIAIFE